MKKLMFVMVVGFGAVSCVQAGDEAGFQLSLIPEVALHGPDTTIHGLSFNLPCGQNPQHGLTLGFYNIVTEQSSGFTVGLLTHAQSYAGVQWGLFNLNSNDFAGWQCGLFNHARVTFKGLESGIINVTDDCRGVQLGGFNYCEKLHGVQIGVLNISTQNRWFTNLPNQLSAVFPVVNWSF